MTVEDDFLASYEDKPEGYLECRGSQHRFVTVEPFRIVDSRNEEGFYAHEGNYTYAYRRMECDRCVDPETGHGMIRHDFYAISSRHGHTYLEKISARYQPPRGYYAPPGLGQIAGNRGLILGAQLDRTMNVTPLRGRGRPRRGAS